jgi:LCP family protein required for cell wall assembly
MKFNKQLLLLLGIVIIGITAYTVIPNFEREEFNPDIIEDISSGTISTTTTLSEINDTSTQETTVPIEDGETFETSIYDSLLINNNSKRIDDLFTSYLIIGSDERSSISAASRGQVEGNRADVIIIIMVDADNNISLVSLPRDLLIEDPCSQNIQRINSSYKNNGCGSNAENLSAVILNVTGLKIDHFVKFSFEGFEKIIDSIGGVEICVNETQREGYSFEIQEGCNNLNGEIALNWIVSRNTEILDGKKIINENGEDISSWKPMPGVSDLTRIKKQQQLILSMMQKINNFESFNSFLNFVNALEDTFTIDKNISTIEASSLLWDFRDINFDNVKKLTVPTYNYRTDNGAEVLILDENFYNFIQSNDLLD